MKQQLKQRLYTVAALAGVVGVALAPLAVSAASDTSNTTITATIGSTISITSQNANAVGFSITPVSGGSQSSASDVVRINTNNATGYTLAVRDTDSNLELSDGTNDINAHTGTIATPTALANNTWGFALPTASMTGVTNGFDASYTPALDNEPSSSSVWAGMTASDQNLRVTSSTATNDDVTIWYSAKADTTKPNGAYTNTVVYTATTNL